MTVFDKIVFFYLSKNFVFIIKELESSNKYELTFFDSNLEFKSKAEIDFRPYFMNEINKELFLLSCYATGLGYVLKIDQFLNIDIKYIADGHQTSAIDKLIDEDKILLLEGNSWTKIDLFYYSISESKNIWHSQGIYGGIKFQNIFNNNTDTKKLFKNEISEPHMWISV